MIIITDTPAVMIKELSLKTIDTSNRKVDDSPDCKPTMMSRDNPSAKLLRVNIS